MPSSMPTPPTARIRLHLPMIYPKEVKWRLAKAGHWKAGYSAHALATTWAQYDGLPPSVRAALEAHPGFSGVELLDGIFERTEDLRDGIRGPSQTDLLALLGLNGRMAVMAVEGKAAESFGDTVEVRIARGGKVLDRVNGLCRTLGPSLDAVLGRGYQLLHRSVAAVRAAQRYRTREAVFLVHAFGPAKASRADYSAFLGLFGLDDQPGLRGPIVCEGVQLFFAWAADPLPVAPARQAPSPA